MVNAKAADALAAELHRLRPHAPPVVSHALTADGRSWVIHGRCWWPLGDRRAFDRVWESKPEQRPVGSLFGRPVTFPRFTQSWGVDYTYTGQVAKARPLAEAPDAVRDVVTELQTIKPLRKHQQVLQNWYEVGGSAKPDYMGPHADDERELVEGAPIVSLTWCSSRLAAGQQTLTAAAPRQPHRRRFRMLPKPHVRDAVVPSGGGWYDLGGATICLGDGDLLVMGGECQRTHKHEVMKPGRDAFEKSGRRINLTVRAFVDEGGRRKLPAAFRSGEREVAAPLGKRRRSASLAEDQDRNA